MMRQQIVKYVNPLLSVIFFILFGLTMFFYFNSSFLITFAKIEKIDIIGSRLSDAHKIREISISKGASLFNYDLENSAKDIKNLNWVKSVSIRKIFPNSLAINITENDPFAYLLKDQKVFLIDIDGEVIVEKNDDAINENKKLILSGTDSEYNLTNLISSLNIYYPDILSTIREIEFIEKRRWNLIFKNNLLIKLPEKDIEKSLKNLKKLIEKDKILKSNIIEVDLRINDRAIIKIDGDKLKIDIEEV